MNKLKMQKYVIEYPEGEPGLPEMFRYYRNYKTISPVCFSFEETRWCGITETYQEYQQRKNIAKCLRGYQYDDVTLDSGDVVRMLGGE